METLGSPLKRLYKTRPENRYIRGAVALAQKPFVTLFTTFILLLLVETIWEGSVSLYLNLNYLLFAVIVVGWLVVLVGWERAEEKEYLGKRDIIIVVCAGFAGAAIVGYKTQEIGWLSYVISAVIGGLIVLSSMTRWRGDEEAEQKYDERTAEAELKAKKEAASGSQNAKREPREKL